MAWMPLWRVRINCITVMCLSRANHSEQCASRMPIAVWQIQFNTTRWTFRTNEPTFLPHDYRSLCQVHRRKVIHINLCVSQCVRAHTQQNKTKKKTQHCIHPSWTITLAASDKCTTHGYCQCLNSECMRRVRLGTFIISSRNSKRHSAAQLDSWTRILALKVELRQSRLIHMGRKTW